jgi:hypothetical protein
MKKPRFFTGYECFKCAKDTDLEAYEAVAIPEMSFTPLSIENWYYYDKRLVKDNLILENENSNSHLVTNKE